MRPTGPIQVNVESLATEVEYRAITNDVVSTTQSDAGVAVNDGVVLEQVALACGDIRILAGGRSAIVHFDALLFAVLDGAPTDSDRRIGRGAGLELRNGHSVVALLDQTVLNDDTCWCGLDTGCNEGEIVTGVARPVAAGSTNGAIPHRDVTTVEEGQRAADPRGIQGYLEVIKSDPFDKHTLTAEEKSAHDVSPRNAQVTETFHNIGGAYGWCLPFGRLQRERCHQTRRDARRDIFFVDVTIGNYDGVTVRCRGQGLLDAGGVRGAVFLDRDGGSRCDRSHPEYQNEANNRSHCLIPPFLVRFLLCPCFHIA